MPDFSIAIALLKRPIEETYKSATSSVRQRLAVVRATARMNALHTRLWQIQKVKTIWNPDRPLSLSTIFHPVDIQIEGEEYSVVRRADSVTDFVHAHCVIYGTAGQGKSILMKYLVGREIRSGLRIPLLCELRDVVGSLEAHLSEKFAVLLGIPNSIDVLDAFAVTGRVSFLLDGFDEVDQGLVQQLLREIDTLAFKYPKAKILVTSRPQSECRTLAAFHRISIKPLAPEDLFSFYKKITKDAEFSKRLVRAVQSSPNGIRELLKTPLLATLLAISYRAAHKIPNEFSEFYEELFQVLLIRHDASKMGWRRKRLSGLTDRQIQQVFEAFCFAVRRKKVLSIGAPEALVLVDACFADAGVSADSQAYLDDMRKITCLLLLEGSRLEFVHASVSHYFASRFVGSRSEKVSANFYTQLLESKWLSWIEELVFLRQIDSHRYLKYFLIPDIEFVLNHFGTDIPAITLRAEQYLAALRVVKRAATDAPDGFAYHVEFGDSLHRFSLLGLREKIYQYLFVSSSEGAANWRTSFLLNPDSTSRSYLEIAADRGAELRGIVVATVVSRITHLKSELRARAEDVAKGEALTDFVTLD